MTVVSSIEMKDNGRLYNLYTIVGNYDIFSTATTCAPQYEAA